MVLSRRDVRRLRDRSGAGTADCERALRETEGDLDAAFDRLRAWGVAKAPEMVRQSFFHRLLDDDRGSTRDPVISLPESEQEFRASVLEDLEWLLNTTRTTVPVDPDRWPELARSVFLYGLPDVASLGATSARDHIALVQSVRRAIELFEPRLRNPRVRTIDVGDDNPLSVRLEIEGQLCMDPTPGHLLLDTVLEISSGRIRLGESDAR